MFTTRFIYTFLLFLSLSPLFGQLQLSGQLLDKDRQPIAFANVMLLQAGDSSLVKGTISEEDGKFQLSVEATGDYLLSTGLIGYKDNLISVSLNEDLELAPMTLETEVTQLSTVEVRAEQPLLEQRGNKMIVNVGNSITGNSGSAIDLLRKVPGLIVVNDQITMAGQSNISILINGKPTQYLDVQSLLRDYPADNIERVEVIQQPGASYDAEGNGGILDIILKKNVRLGTNGAVRLRAGRGQLWKYGAATSLNYRDERINWSNRVSYNHNSGYEEMVLDRKVGPQTFLQTNRQPYLPHSLSLNSSLDYQLTERQEAGLSVQLFGSRNESTDENSTLIFDEEILQQELLTLNRDKRRSGLYTIDGYYQFELDTAGQKWSVDGAYYQYGRDAQNLLNTIVLPGQEPALFPSQRQEQPGHNHIYSFKTDYELPLAEGHLLSAGLKYSNAAVDNDLQALVQQGQDWTTLDSLSNHFRFNETIQAAYLSYQFSFGKVSGQAGLRYEHNNTEGYAVTR
ncbi:MAG: outer membrane beta-barrel protein [Phaeodactylibacter sp.]|nr:outer membrane beta-barrel protein [Phaeodactylibacter sp.]